MKWMDINETYCTDSSMKMTWNTSSMDPFIELMHRHPWHWFIITKNSFISRLNEHIWNAIRQWTELYPKTENLFLYIISVRKLYRIVIYLCINGLTFGSYAEGRSGNKVKVNEEDRITFVFRFLLPLYKVYANGPFSYYCGDALTWLLLLWAACEGASS